MIPEAQRPVSLHLQSELGLGRDARVGDEVFHRFDGLGKGFCGMTGGQEKGEPKTIAAITEKTEEQPAQPTAPSTGPTYPGRLDRSDPAQDKR